MTGSYLSLHQDQFGMKEQSHLLSSMMRRETIMICYFGSVEVIMEMDITHIDFRFWNQGGLGFGQVWF